MLEEHLPTVSVDNHAQEKSDCPTVETLPSSSPSIVKTHSKSSVTQNYSKHFKTVQVPFKSTNNQSLSWHGKGSDDNLVISFSDDDSPSNSEESKSEKTISRKENMVSANKSEVPIVSAPVPSRGLQGGPNRTKHVLKKGLVNPALISSETRACLTSSRYLATSAEKNSPPPRHNLTIRTSARQEHGHVPDPNVADHRLASLRHEIALRENELKVQGKSIPQSNEKNVGSFSDNHGPHTMLLATKAAGVKRPASVAGKGLATKEKTTKHLKSAVGSNNKQSSAGLLQLATSSRRSARDCSSQHMGNSDVLYNGDIMESHNVINGKRKHVVDTSTLASSGVLLRKDSRSLVPVPASVCSGPTVSSKQGNYTKAVADVSRSCNSEKRDMAVDYPTLVGQNSCLLQSGSNIEDGALHERNLFMHKNLSKGHARLSNIPRQTDAFTLVPNKAQEEHSIKRTQQNLATTGTQIPLETSSHISERRSGQAPERKSGNDENTSTLNYSSQINISAETRMNLQSLMDLEELQDKEIEEAQELRRKCELEERRALKAYRMSQRALVDANEKCSLLYRKRELFSAQLRALLMQASSSIWPSGWQSHGGTVSESIETLPDSRLDLLSSLGHQLHVEGRVLGQLGYEANAIHAIDARPGVSCQQLNELVSGQCWEQDASTSDHRDNSGLDGAATPAHHPNLSNDDEIYPFDDRSAQCRLKWNTADGNHVQTIGDVNEPARLQSDENVQDYELLEASLRSKLVKRLGNRISNKSNKIDEAKCLVQEGADKSGDATMSPLPDQQMQEGEKSEMLDLEGVERLGRSTNQLIADCHSHDNDISLTDDAHRDRDFHGNSFFHTESCRPHQTVGSTLPSSVLHVACGHAKSILVGCSPELSTTQEKEAMLREKFADRMADGETTLYNIGFVRTDEMEFNNYDHSIDPFWPFCMFELRGKCNNEECRWQHIKHCTQRNLKQNKHSAASCTDSQASHLLSAENSDDAIGPPNGLFHHILSIPTYHIGSSLIKVDSHVSQSVMARSIWQYWQRGFCASFSVPFSVQRILPPDAPFLHGGGGSVADDYSWNRRSLYFQTLDSSLQFVHGLPESEQSLEMVFDLLDGRVCKPDRKKALCMLSRAIETNPTSVVLWVIYLHIYYGKEKNLGRDDMFFHAVQHNEGSYELWLMYINSRMQLDDRLNAYEYALTTFCSIENAFDEERCYISTCILDIFLQMIDFLRMSGNVEKAIQKIFGLLGNSGDTLLLDIQSCLIVSDRCIFWSCCIYLAVYRKLPELIVQQFEFEKELPFGIEWPSAHLTTDRKKQALDLMKFAVDKMDLGSDINPHRKDEVALRSLHFLAVSHIRCTAALEGLHCYADLLTSYLSLYPTCIDLILLSARLKENYTENMVLKGFEESLSDWPRETSGTQCLWNQYVEHALANERAGLAEILLDSWFRGFSKDTNLHVWKLEGRKDGACDSFDLSLQVNSDDSITGSQQDDMFWFLNLSLYRLLQKNLRDSQCAIDKALKIASPQDYKHCVREHAAFAFANEASSESDKPLGSILSLLNGYLGDTRSTTIVEPLSRKYYRYIKRPRVRQFINNILGPVSRDASLVNSVLEVCYGTSFLPENLDDSKGFVDFVESLMEITPANYKLAFSVYKLTKNFCHPSVAANANKLWACSLLINSIFQAIPVAPEYVWLEAARAIKNVEILDISVRFHQQALSVYPFSIKLWQSYLGICRNTDNVDMIVESAKQRGIVLS